MNVNNTTNILPVILSAESTLNAPRFITYIENNQIILKQIEDVKTQENLKMTVANDKHENNTEEFDTNRRMHIKSKKPMSYLKEEFRKMKTSANGFIGPRRRRLLIDYHTQISPKHFKKQLDSTEDILAVPEIAPCTKLQMKQLAFGITRIFAYPSRKITNSKLLQLYVSNCTTQKMPNEIENVDLILQPLSSTIEVEIPFHNYLIKRKKCEYTKDYGEHTPLIINDLISDHKYSKEVIDPLLVTKNEEKADPIIDLPLQTSKEETLISTKDLNLSENTNYQVFKRANIEIETIKQEETNENDGILILNLDGNEKELSKDNIEMILQNCSNLSNLSNKIVTICGNNVSIQDNNQVILMEDEIKEEPTPEL